MHTVSADLLSLLEAIRSKVKKAVHVTSGRRCTEHNAKIGGALNSQHLKGRAADIMVKGLSPVGLGWIAYCCGAPGVIVYSNWVHVDTRQKVYHHGLWETS